MDLSLARFRQSSPTNFKAYQNRYDGNTLEYDIAIEGEKANK